MAYADREAGGQAGNGKLYGAGGGPHIDRVSLLACFSQVRSRCTYRSSRKRVGLVYCTADGFLAQLLLTLGEVWYGGCKAGRTEGPHCHHDVPIGGRT